MLNKLKTTRLWLVCLGLALTSSKNSNALNFSNSFNEIGEEMRMEPDSVPAGHLQHDITFTHAAMLVQNLLNTPSLLEISKKAGYSGFMSRQTMDEMVPAEGDMLTSGLIFYLCYDNANTSNTDDDSVFLACRYITGFNPLVTEPSINNNDIFYRSNFPLSYQGDDNPTMASVKETLLGEISTANTENRTIYGQYVKECSTEFMSKFQANDEVSSQMVNCNRFAFGFVCRQELNMIRFPDGVAQADISGLRFYLGFDNTENDNRIRVIFLTASPTKNYVIKNSDLPYTIYYRIIERSRP